MKNLKSKLFKELELTNANSEKVNGGRYTSTSSDTGNTGSGYDIKFDTLDSGGSSTGQDSVISSLGTQDAPR